MDILPILLDIGFVLNDMDRLDKNVQRIGFLGDQNYYRYYKYYDDGQLKFMYYYAKDTNGIPNIAKQGTNYVPIRIEIKEENEEIIYAFLSTEFGKDYIRDYKINKLLE